MYGTTCSNSRAKVLERSEFGGVFGRTSNWIDEYEINLGNVDRIVKKVLCECVIDDFLDFSVTFHLISISKSACNVRIAIHSSGWEFLGRQSSRT